MNLELPPSASAFAASARRALTGAGGLDLARRAEARPAVRVAEVEPVLARLGVFELDVRGDEESAFAGAEISRLAGALALPYPVSARLACPAGSERGFAALVDGGGPGAAGWTSRHWIEHADLEGPWWAIDVDGTVRPAVHEPGLRNRTMAPFAEPVSVGAAADRSSEADRALPMNLESWRILGAVEAAHALTVGHVQEREQFSRPLAAFQGVQFHVADAEVAVRGLRQLARFTTWRHLTGAAGVLGDALALRAVALEAARTVLGTSQLLHGATGFCDEHDLTTIVRSAQAPLRMPADLERTSELLAAAIDREGFAGLYDEPTPAGEQVAARG